MTRPTPPDEDTSIAVGASAPLEHCPACDYSLKGLPERHRCPECGLLCDQSMEVFQGNPNLVEWILWAGAGMGFVGSLGTAISGRGVRDLLLFMLLILIPLYFRSLRAARFILGPGGLTIVRRGRPTETIEWAVIRGAAYVSASGAARIVTDPVQEARNVPQFAVGGFHECLRFVKAVNELRDRYAPVERASPAPPG